MQKSLGSQSQSNAAGSMAWWPSRRGQEAIKTTGVVSPSREGSGSLRGMCHLFCSPSLSLNEACFSHSSSLYACSFFRSRFKHQCPWQLVHTDTIALAILCCNLSECKSVSLRRNKVLKNKNWAFLVSVFPVTNLELGIHYIYTYKNNIYKMYIGEKTGKRQRRFHLGVYRICINLLIAHVFQWVLGLILNSYDIPRKINIDKYLFESTAPLGRKNHSTTNACTK